jgi:predicted anti-sigma-YlaC factor YlaD
MACRFAADHVTDALEGRLTGARAAYYRLHMRVCPHCQAFRDQLVRVTEATGALPAAEEPRDVDPKILAAFRAKTKRADE